MISTLNCIRNSLLWTQRFVSVRTRRKQTMELSLPVWSLSHGWNLSVSLLVLRQMLEFRLRSRRRIQVLILPLPSSSWPSSPCLPTSLHLVGKIGEIVNSCWSCLHGLSHDIKEQWRWQEHFHRPMSKHRQINLIYAIEIETKIWNFLHHWIRFCLAPKSLLRVRVGSADKMVKNRNYARVRDGKRSCVRLTRPHKRFFRFSHFLHRRLFFFAKRNSQSCQTERLKLRNSST